MRARLSNPLATLVLLFTVVAKVSSAAVHGVHRRQGGGGDPQFSTTIDPSQIQQSLNFNGIVDGGDPAISPSLTSPNNFINFCLTQSVPLTDGKQVQGGSCNPTPMGRIAARDRMPSAKFVSPRNGDVLEPFQPFTIKLAVRQFQPGAFTNAATNYFSAPQAVNDQGFIIGHSHVVIERTEIDGVEPLDPLAFDFFKGLNAGLVDGVLSTEVTEGLEPGVYRLSSITTSANHTPALVGVAQHGNLDDVVYFEVQAQDDADAGDDGECLFEGF